jgi:hypothetical protein
MSLVLKTLSKVEEFLQFFSENSNKVDTVPGKNLSLMEEDWLQSAVRLKTEKQTDLGLGRVKFIRVLTDGSMFLGGSKTSGTPTISVRKRTIHTHTHTHTH